MWDSVSGIYGVDSLPCVGDARIICLKITGKDEKIFHWGNKHPQSHPSHRKQAYNEPTQNIPDALLRIQNQRNKLKITLDIKFPPPQHHDNSVQTDFKQCQRKLYRNKLT